MKQYELTVLFHPDLEMNIEPALEKVKRILTDQGITIAKITADGKRRLAYAIQDQEFAVYYTYEVAAAGNAVTKASAIFNITDEVLRYLFVAVDPRQVAKHNNGKEEAK